MNYVTAEEKVLFCRKPAKLVFRIILALGGESGYFLSLGKIEGSDSQGESLHKILYQAYIPHAEKSQIYSNVDMSTFSNLSCFPARKKINRQADRQLTDLQMLGHPLVL
jgi:hypothetical protein